jgi:transcriptional regulator GlxA family with amidase domain
MDRCVESDVLQLIKQTIGVVNAPVLVPTLPVRRKMLDYRLRKAMNHMRENLANPSIAEEVADLVGLSRSRFFELFHDELGTSPNVFWNAVRCEEAAKRLQHSPENMTTMAMDLGFSSPGNFSRFFKEHMGVTPSTFRRVTHGL